MPTADNRIPDSQVAEPPFSPFNYCHSSRGQIFFQAGDDDLLACSQSVQIHMRQREPAARIEVDQRERRRVHSFRNSQSSSKALDQLRFARPEVTAQANQQTA